MLSKCFAKNTYLIILQENLISTTTDNNNIKMYCDGGKMKNIYVPVKGKVIDITKVSDSMFADKILGDGMAVIPTGNDVCSPIDGVIESIYPTNHAFVVRDDENHKLLVHIGIDTVTLDGEPFQRILEVGERVKQGMCVIKSDYKLIEAKGIDSTVIVICPEEVILQKAEEVESDVQHVLFVIE